MISRLGRRERRPLAFEDIISETDFFSDETYAFYTIGTSGRKLNFVKAQTAGWREVEEVSRVFALAAIVSIIVGLSLLAGVLRI